MLKKIITIAAVASVCAIFSTAAQAQCGGSAQYNPDSNGNGRGVSWSCCPSGYRVQGVAYNDMRNSSNNDVVDAVSAICRHIQKGNDMMPSDFQAQPITLMCDKSEVMAGIGTDDLKGSDAMDGIVVYCQHPGSSNLRVVGNNGDSGGRGPTMTTLLPKRVVGVGYADMDKGGSGSDGADFATVSVK